MVKIFLKLFFLVNALITHGQNIVVVDSLHKTPLPFVAIKYEGGGFYTNEIGQFNLDGIKGNYLQLSLLGYKTKSIAKMSLKDTIFLSSNPTALDEVTINKQLEKTIIYKKPKKTNFLGSSILSSKMGIYLILIPDSMMENTKIENVTIYFEKKDGLQNHKKDTLEMVDAFVRINIHGVVNGQPVNHLFATEPIKISSFKRGEFVVDLSDEMINIPKEGISVNIEMIGYYDKSYNELDDQGYVRPMLTPQKYEHFKAVTYKHFPFWDADNFVLISDFIKSFPEGTKYSDRNLAIGMTLKQ